MFWESRMVFCSLFCAGAPCLNSERGHGATILGVIGTGVPPLIEAFTPFAYWGALKELRIEN